MKRATRDYNAKQRRDAGMRASADVRLQVCACVIVGGCGCGCVWVRGKTGVHVSAIVHVYNARRWWGGDAAVRAGVEVRLKVCVCVWGGGGRHVCAGASTQNKHVRARTCI